MRLRPLAAATLAAAGLAAAPIASAQTGSLDSGSLGGPGAGSSAMSTGSTGGAQSGPSTSYAVIGDVPYGDTLIRQFPTMISQINAANPAFTVHVGDIKNGSTVCSDQYLSLVKTDFSMFTGPLVYAPGDNEWTDCHRANNGAYDPLERLAKVRSTFFPAPGTTLGKNPMSVYPVNPARTPEDVRWSVPGASMASIHVVGSNDDLKPWTGIGKTEATPAQVAEQAGRMADAIETVRQAFGVAKASGQKAVAIHLQADMFDPSYTPKWTDISAFKPLVQALVDQSKAFDGKVYLFDGDSHKYNVDTPLAAGSPWLATYGVTGAATNLTRITCDGEADAVKDWLKITVTPGAADPITWKQVPFTL